MNAAPVSRRARPAKAPLSREIVVETGLRILDTDGLAALTMRRVARELDTGAASLYVYIANRDDLMAAMLDDVVAAIPEPEGRDWRDRLAFLVDATVAAIGRHQGLATVALGAPPTETVRSRLFARMRALLAEGGVSDERVGRWAVELLYQYVIAAAAGHGPGESAVAARVVEWRGDRPGGERPGSGRTAGTGVSGGAKSDDRRGGDPLGAVRGAAGRGDGSHDHGGAAREVGHGAGPDGRRSDWELRVLIEGILATPVG